MGCLWSIIFIAVVIFTSCDHSTKKSLQDSHLSVDCVIDTVFITNRCDRKENAGSSKVDFVILKENEYTMFAEINKILDAYGKYFIVDTYGSRKVVSFDHQGNPLTTYGCVGNGPGEYVYPWDVDITEEFVYILDVSQRNLNKYRHDGSFVNAVKTPFRCNAFSVLNENRMLFNLAPSDKTNNCQIALTDSTLTVLDYNIPYADGYVDSWVTNNAFRKGDNEVVFYSSPSDTLYRFNYDGHLKSKTVLEFKDCPLPEIAKLNFAAAEQDGLIKSGLHLRDNPIELPNGYMIFKALDYTDNEAYLYTLDTDGNKCLKQKNGDRMSIYDILIPCSKTCDNRVISYINREIVDQCYDLEEVPDDMLQALNDGNRILTLHTLKR